MADRRVSVQIDADVSPFVRGLTEAAAEAKAFSTELESSTSQMNGLVQAGLALAPALVPIGAAAVPAIAGLTTELGFAALAAGTAALAFHGVSDAIKALDTYKAAPTAANFAKLQKTFSELGPAGQEFALYIDKLKPKLESLQAVAEVGMLPGVEDGLNHVLHLMPQVKDVIFNVSSTLGELSKEAGAGLDSPKWRDFIGYIDTTARPILTQMGHAIGNVAGGFAALIQDMDPLSRSFSDELLHMSAAFEKWAQGLSKTQGFQDFLAYVEKSGPEVGHALAAVADALVQIVKDAAPVGSVTLVVIKDLAEALGAIAATPVGPVLIGAASAVVVLSKALMMLKAVGIGVGETSAGGRMLGMDAVKSAPGAYREAAAATKELAAAEREAGLAHARYIGALKGSSANLEVLGTTTKGAAKASDELWNANGRLASATERARTAEAARSEALRGTLTAAGKAVGVVGGLALATSGLADKTGLSNTASMALMGTIAGPWGAAIGGGVGLVMDLAHANDSLENAIRGANAAAASTQVDIGAQGQAIAGLSKALADYQAGIHGWNLLNFKADMNTISDLWTHSESAGERAVASQTRSFAMMKTGLVELHAALDPKAPSWFNDPTTAIGIQQRNADLQKFADQIAPAAAAAGIDLKKALQTPAGRADLAQAVKEYDAALDSATGKSAAVGKALAELGSKMQSTTGQADALKTAMDSLFGTQLSQSQATDAWITSLKQLQAQIGKTNGQVRGTSQAALDNRAAIRSSVQALQAKVAADAAAGVSGRKLVGTLLDGARQIEHQGVAAGVSRKQMRAYLDTLGLTPKNLKTIITTPGLLSAKQQVEALGRLYHLTPKQVTTLIKQLDMAKSQSDIDALTKKYHLTPAQVRTFVNLLGVGPAIGQVSALQQKLDALHSKDVTVRVNEIHATSYGPGAKATAGHAGGGYIRGPGTTTSDSIPAWLSDKEFVVRAAAVEKYGVAMMHDINTMRFASGGQVHETAAQRKKRLQAEATARAAARTQRLQLQGYDNSFNLSAGMSIASLNHELETFSLAIRRAGDRLGSNFRALSRRAHEVDRAYFKSEASMKRETAARDALVQARDSAVSAAQGAFTTDIYGGSLSTLSHILGHDTAQAKAMTAALATAKSHGLSGGLAQGLAQSGNVLLAQQFATLSRSQIAGYEKQFAARQAATNQLGSLTASFFAKQINAANAQIKADRATQRQLAKVMEKLEHAIEAGVHRSVHVDVKMPGAGKGAADAAGKRIARHLHAKGR